MGKRVFFIVGLILSFSFGFPHVAGAKVKLPILVADGMVLQREQNINVWGFADPGEDVTVTFLKKKYKTAADAGGNWKVTLPPQKAGGPYTMLVNDIELMDILIGDVYLCSGQSNMELPVSRVTDRYLDEVKAYSNPMIRHIKVPLTYDFHAPQDDIRPAAWKPLTQENVMGFSALAYFFARQMYEKNKVPVGMLNSSVGGSPVEAWMSEEALKPFPKYLNERDMYRYDEYVSNLRKVESERSHIWNILLYKTDTGLHESKKWYEADYDDSSWKRFNLFDSSWNADKYGTINGSHWFRKEFNVPQELASREAVLRMGCIVDADSVYINGTFVGTVAYQYPPRIYRIPPGLLKSGTNQITVRLISYSGQPHFVEEKPYKVILGEREIGLEGEWKHRLGTRMPVAQGGTTLQYKPVGLYNAMIAPLQNYAVKGAIWYQGESNTGRAGEYYDLLTAMIADWRSLWQQPALPFVIVELAGFGKPTDTYFQRQWGEFRKVQHQVAADTPHAAIARAEDLGEWNDIHPLNKKDLGIRVANEMEKLIQK